MFGLEEIMCCGREYHEEERRSSNKTDLLTNTTGCLFLHPLLAYHPDADSYSSPVLVDNPNISMVGSGLHWHGPIAYQTYREVTTLDFLEALATALHRSHVTGIVHGNLTPASSCLLWHTCSTWRNFFQEWIGVVHGRDVLINEGCSSDCQLSWTREASDDDIYSARWAATEFFRLDNGDPRPTKMSDVYSFACLMLQMLTGRVPYCGTKRPEQVVYLKYLGREPIDAQTPRIADRYVAFMRWCWSPEPEKRPTMETVVGFIREEIKKLGE